MNKQCVRCQETQPLENFTNNKNKKDGKCPYCRNCYSLKNKEWRNANPDKVNTITKKWRSNNKEKIKRYSLNQYYKNTDEAKERNRKYKAKNKQKVNENNKSYYHRKYKIDPCFKIKITLRNRFFKLVKGINKTNSVLELLGCSIEFFKGYIEKKFKKGMSWDNHGEWHIDHIKPCASFDLTKYSEQQKCFHYSNLQPLWALDNIKKSDNIIS